MTKPSEYKWRFYADNNVEKEIIEFLRDSNMDILWVAEEDDLHKQQDDSFHYQKARNLGRYLLTYDMDFWNDRKHPLKTSPGVVILATRDISFTKYLPVLLRKLLRDYNPLTEPLYLDGIKIKLSEDGIVIKMVDKDTQKVTQNHWSWADIV
jgi:predicted nuclease of predicted toxin-antitoxin system